MHRNRRNTRGQNRERMPPPPLPPPPAFAPPPPPPTHVPPLLADPTQIFGMIWDMMAMMQKTQQQMQVR